MFLDKTIFVSCLSPVSLSRNSSLLSACLRSSLGYYSLGVRTRSLIPKTTWRAPTGRRRDKEFEKYATACSRCIFCVLSSAQGNFVVSTCNGSMTFCLVCLLWPSLRIFSLNIFLVILFCYVDMSAASLPIQLSNLMSLCVSFPIHR